MRALPYVSAILGLCVLGVWSTPPAFAQTPESAGVEEPAPAAEMPRRGNGQIPAAYPPPPQPGQLKQQPTGQPSGPPPNARGKCGTWVLVPPITRTVSEEFTLQPATTRHEWVPPRFESRTEQVLVTPASVRITPIPAVYEAVTESTMVSPARQEWQLVDCSEVELKPGEIQGASWCLVDVPPVFENRTRQVLRSAASFKKEEIPAVYKTIEVQALVQEGSWRDVPVPAVVQTRTRQETVAAAHWEWRDSAPCDKKLAPPPPPPPAHVRRDRCGCDIRGRR